LFEIQDLLLVTSYTATVVPEFDGAGIHFRLHLRTGWQRD
jgi:hypothetical protein